MAGGKHVPDDSNRFCVGCPNDFAFVDWRQMINMNAHVSRRVWSVKDGNRCAFGFRECLAYLLGRNAEEDFCHTRQGLDTGQKVLFATLEHIRCVCGKGHTAECCHEYGFRSVVWFCCNGVWAFLQQGQHARFHEKGFHICPCHVLRTLGAEVHCRLLAVGFHFNGQYLAAFATNYGMNGSADRRNHAHLRLLLVYEQGIANFYRVALANDHFGLHSVVVVGTQGVDAAHGGRFFHFFCRSGQTHVTSAA